MGKNITPVNLFLSIAVVILAIIVLVLITRDDTIPPPPTPTPPVIPSIMPPTLTFTPIPTSYLQPTPTPITPTRFVTVTRQPSPMRPPATPLPVTQPVPPCDPQAACGSEGIQDIIDANDEDRTQMMVEVHDTLRGYGWVVSEINTLNYMQVNNNAFVQSTYQERYIFKLDDEINRSQTDFLYSGVVARIQMDTQSNSAASNPYCGIRLNASDIDAHYIDIHVYRNGRIRTEAKLSDGSSSTDDDQPPSSSQWRMNGDGAEILLIAFHDKSGTTVIIDFMGNADAEAQFSVNYESSVSIPHYGPLHLIVGDVERGRTTRCNFVDLQQYHLIPRNRSRS